ncbi:C6 transcription factor [Neofusicoccum parvum]|uniref:C6 transcription factor n=1 Tax=Neofusicoccum parvum TaxID=310453 RepID=A0ACB5SM23_9PEZI|nr:C6 transcription factor [Neofusicoccum parvum]GME64094.1 C6 transcription factor [Neofusicoccum parvum]
MEAPPPPPPPPPEPASPTKTADSDGKSKRTTIACLTCRKRKSRCHLDYENDKPKLPCERCKAQNLECVLGGSNRGGRRVRRKTLSDNIGATRNLTSAFAVPGDNVAFHGLGNMGTTTTSPLDQRLNFASLDTGNPRQTQEEPPSQASGATPMEFDNLQNPSDALGILARVAEEDTPAPAQERANFVQPVNPGLRASPYRLLADGKLTVNQVVQLIQRYRAFYHPFYPLAPPQVFDINRLHETAQKEPTLLTAILVIASKDLVEETHMYEICAKHMKDMISDLAAGGPGDVDAVEALLLLAEWAPFTQRAQSGKVGKGEEDREAWNSSGLALRLAYFLGLEKYSFKVTDDGRDPQFSRKLLVWTACYIADRTISIRIGKAFWSRGPGPLTSLRRDHYPSLLPQTPNDEDYASIFQNNVGAVGDARFIYEGLDAAKAILTTCNNFIDPEKALRFMPLRFFLYLVYSGVFLFRAKIVGVIEGEEERGIRRMIDETIDRLQRSSVGTQHLGSRYSQLLKLLWEKADNHKPPGRSRGSHVGHRNHYGDAAGLSQSTPAATSQAGSGSMGESPMGNNANVEGIGDFSWTDLNTIGEFAVSQGQLTGMDVFGGFLPLEVGNVWDMGQFDGGGEMTGMAF